MESPEDEEVFFGPVSQKEQHLRQKWSSRTTDVFSNTFVVRSLKNDSNLSDDDSDRVDENISVKKEPTENLQDCYPEGDGNDVSAGNSPTVSQLKINQNVTCEFGELNMEDAKSSTQTKRSSSSVNSQRTSASFSTRCLALDQTFSPLLKSPAKSQSKDARLNCSEATRPFQKQELLLLEPINPAVDLALDRSYERNVKDSKTSSSQEVGERLSEAFEDLRLISLPPGSDVTLTPESRFGNRLSPARKKGTPTLSFLKCEKLPDLCEEGGDLRTSESQYVPPTPCNSTASSVKQYELNSFDQRDMEQSGSFVNQHDVTIPCNNTKRAQNSTGYHSNEADVIILSDSKPCSSNNAQKLGSSVSHLEKLSTFHSPRMQTVQNELEERCDKTLEFPENELEIVTVLADDLSESEECCAVDEQMHKENVTPKSLTLSVTGSSSLNRNPIKVPEMTDHQRNLFRQLMLSPEPDPSNTSADSPLMNALDLSTIPETPVTSLAGSKSSLATLDLSVDNRIPVANYISRVNNRQIPVQMVMSGGLLRTSEKPPSRGKSRQTPMRLISNKLGIVNIDSQITSQSREKKTERKEIFKPEKGLFAPVGLTPKSAIPVREGSSSEFKKPAMVHGINVYRSKATGAGNARLFSSPALQNKKWNVKSPVAQYINDNPAPPLMKIIRPKDKQSVSPQPVSLMEHQKEKKMGRLFASPYTPKVIKSRGPRKGVLVSGCGIPQHTQVVQLSRNNTSEAADVTINETVILQRTKTLFNPID